MVSPVKKIVIVGGGTAGWLTAGIIAAKHQGRMPGGFSVTLVESPTKPIIGVGEGTWPTLRTTLAKMGVSETDFFRECDAAFKQGAKFARWKTGAEEDAYYHPLMLPQGFSRLNLVPHWLGNGASESFCDAVCPQGKICDDGLAPKTIATPEYEALANYSYHLDAGKFAPFLQRHCTTKLGVSHVLQGSVRKAGNRLRISAQLLDHTGRQLWTETFDRELADIFDIQEEIARAVATTAASRVVSRPVASYHPNIEAYEHYLAGRERLHRRVELESALEELQRAYDDVVVQLRTAYTITYASNTSPSGNPRVRVRANREGASVRLSPAVGIATP